MILTLLCISRSDNYHERNLDHILEARNERDLIVDHYLGGTYRKKDQITVSLEVKIIFFEQTTT